LIEGQNRRDRNYSWGLGQYEPVERKVEGPISPERVVAVMVDDRRRAPCAAAKESTPNPIVFSPSVRSGEDRSCLKLYGLRCNATCRPAWLTTAPESKRFGLLQNWCLAPRSSEYLIESEFHEAEAQARNFGAADTTVNPSISPMPAPMPDNWNCAFGRSSRD